MPPLLPILFPVFYISDRISKRKETIRNREEEQKENELKAKIGLRPDENYMCFSHMGGAGVIKCTDCGYEEKNTSFSHGFYSCTIGRHEAVENLNLIIQNANAKIVISSS